MKNFSEFIKYESEHIGEVNYDITSFCNDKWTPNITLTKDDITLIQTASHLTVIAVLRQFHNCLNSENV